MSILVDYTIHVTPNYLGQNKSGTNKQKKKAITYISMQTKRDKKMFTNKTWQMRYIRTTTSFVDVGTCCR